MIDNRDEEISLVVQVAVAGRRISIGAAGQKILAVADWLAQYGEDYGSLKHVDIARHLRARVEREL